MKEIWKDIKHYKGLYQISNLGNVKSLKRLIADKRRSYWSKERILKGGVTSTKKMQGYKFVVLSKNKKTRSFYVHRLVASAFISNKKNKTQVNHIDGNKLNNNVDNLEWCTPLENTAHAIKNKLTPNGENLNYSKLTQKQVDFIRYQIENNYYRGIQRDLALKYCVSKSAITLIKNKTNWSGDKK